MIVRGAAACLLVVMTVSCGSVPAWSPSGSDLLYTTRLDGNAELVRRSPDGAVVNLTNDPAPQHWGRVSPDGRWLAYQTRPRGQWDLAIRDLEAPSARPVIVVEDEAEDVLPEWSPDGRQLLFFSSRGEPRGPNGQLRGHLYALTIDSRSERRVTREPLPSSFGGDWLPDGRAIILSREIDGDVELVRLDLEGGTETRLTHRPGSDYGVAVSPDGRRVAFSSTRGEEALIAILTLATGEVTEVTSGGQHYDPRWSPDGLWLVFTGAPLGATQFDILAVPAAGGPATTLIATEADERGASWVGRLR